MRVQRYKVGAGEGCTINFAFKSGWQLRNTECKCTPAGMKGLRTLALSQLVTDTNVVYIITC